MSIQLTEKAAERVIKMLDKRGHGLGLRLSTKPSGCTGFAYEVDYADEVDQDDHLFETNGVKVIVDADSLKLIDGTTVDYVKMNALNEGFDFINPNVKDVCGCGESFKI
ncbi:MAG: iron-sulfur cluster assembly accessory protein [Gammaproteobacteria bacterium]|nr:iron-sulfur cluster assembly accessory protein [Gammaproteobacteria bacterium]